MIPIRTDYRMRRTPWVNYGLLASNVLVFILGFNGLSPASQAGIWEHLLHPNQPRLDQFFSSMFLHAGWMHLLGNMVFLWVFGNAMNDKFGHLGYLCFYLAGGLLAGVGYLILDPVAPVLGASGAIAAVTGAYLVLLPRARVTVLLIYFFIMPLEISSLYFLLFQFAWNLFMTTAVLGDLAGGGVAYAAHTAGYVYGIGVAAALLATRVMPRDPFDLLSLVRGRQRRARYRRMVDRGFDPFGHISPDLRRPGTSGAWVDARNVGQAPPSDTAAAKEMQLRRDISQAVARHDVADAAKMYLRLVQLVEDAVLPRQQQLDVANQLMADQQYPAAAEAYERFLRHYPRYEHPGDIHLLLGLIYGRYLHQYQQAEQSLSRALELLHDASKSDLARSELQSVRQRRR
jgi:membrane associated rhomboid family serine protease